MIKFTIPLAPRTKKNSQQIVKGRFGKYMIIPSKLYRQYEQDSYWHMPRITPIGFPVNVKAVYYMPTHRRVDLVNLHEALLDIMVKHGVIADDNCTIVVSMDGSRVDYDPDDPRTEVTITAHVK